MQTFANTVNAHTHTHTHTHTQVASTSQLAMQITALSMQTFANTGNSQCKSQHCQCKLLQTLSMRTRTHTHTHSHTSRVNFLFPMACNECKTHSLGILPCRCLIIWKFNAWNHHRIISKTQLPNSWNLIIVLINLILQETDGGRQCLKM